MTRTASTLSVTHRNHDFTGLSMNRRGNNSWQSCWHSSDDSPGKSGRQRLAVLLALAILACSGCTQEESSHQNDVEAPFTKSPDTIQVAADPWCPYNCEPGHAHQGLMIDIAKAALKRSGYTLNYQIINWARAKKMVENGQLDGIVGMSREAVTETRYHFSNTPLGWSQICFFKRADDDWTYQSTASLEDKTMGWINDYGFTNQAIDQWVKARRNTSAISTVAGVEVHHSLFQMLLAKRIDTFAEDFYVVQHELKQDALSDAISVAGCAPEKDEVHIAFSLLSPHKEKWAEALDRGVQEIRTNGVLERILQHYNLSLSQWQK